MKKFLPLCLWICVACDQADVPAIAPASQASEPSTPTSEPASLTNTVSNPKFTVQTAPLETIVNAPFPIQNSEYRPFTLAPDAQPTSQTKAEMPVETTLARLPTAAPAILQRVPTERPAAPTPKPAATVVGPIMTLDGQPLPATQNVKREHDASRTIEETSYFYEPLAEYGTWYDSVEYGRIWHPHAATTTNWQPFVDGRWTYTNVGWTWYSNEPFGWATYHYGRWTNLHQVGWCWIPGREWCAAPVTWRVGSNFVGWAPLPPRFIQGGRYFDPSTGHTIDPCVTMGIGPDWFVFLHQEHLGRNSYNDCVWDRRERERCLLDSTSLSIPWNDEERQDWTYQHRGPRFEDVTRHPDCKIPRVQLNFRHGDDPRGISRLDSRNYTCQIPRPRNHKGRSIAATNIGNIKEQRGWKNESEWEKIQRELARRRPPTSPIEQPKFPPDRPVTTTPKPRNKLDRVSGHTTEQPNPKTSTQTPPIQRPNNDLAQPRGHTRPRAPDLETDIPMLPELPETVKPRRPPPVPAGDRPSVFPKPLDSQPPITRPQARPTPTIQRPTSPAVGRRPVRVPQNASPQRPITRDRQSTAPGKAAQGLSSSPANQRR